MSPPKKTLDGPIIHVVGDFEKGKLAVDGRIVKRPKQEKALLLPIAPDSFHFL
ncbi:MAG: hypothetical protein WBJ83_09865 [Thermacetogeniaceae bacterium]|jgi:hypothetical protein|nr:hypothetical protein [Syntrophomonadaceae bacterium]